MRIAARVPIASGKLSYVMDFLLPIVLLVLAGFCWLLAAGERDSDRDRRAAVARNGAVRYAHPRSRAVAPALVAAACLFASVEIVRARGPEALPLLLVGALLTLAFAWLALRAHREWIDYFPGRGLRVAHWTGYRWVPLSRIVQLTHDHARGWRPGHELATLAIGLDDGSRIDLDERLRGFADLVARLGEECSEGILERNAEE